MDLRESPADFFTRDLDKRVIDGDLDFAIHSAKDMPEEYEESLDWFRLPWCESRDDVIICRGEEDPETLGSGSIVGVSSERREDFVRKNFPEMGIKSIRGNVEERIEQLDRGGFDMIITAEAAVNRLGLQNRITKRISRRELPTPSGQGCIGITFCRNDPRFVHIRDYFIKAVRFVGAGCGSGDMCTQKGIIELSNCDVCLYDSLMDKALLSYLKEDAVPVFVGKRSGRHSLKQGEIVKLIMKYTRYGKRVVRLKGGDPGIFGRLSEEIDELEKFGIPYRVIPGISSLNYASTSSGILLTRRGISRGFTVYTPRQAAGGSLDFTPLHEKKLPYVFFMSVNILKDVKKSLIESGLNSETRTAVILNSGFADERIIRGSLEDICGKLDKEDSGSPGIVIVGEIAGYSYRKTLGGLKGKRVLLTCSENLIPGGERIIDDFGGIPVRGSLIKLEMNHKAKDDIKDISKYDWIVLTSPSSVRFFMIFLKEGRKDIRRLPKIMVCGKATAGELLRHNLYPDAVPETCSGAEGIAEIVSKISPGGAAVLRFRSDLAGRKVSQLLAGAGAVVTDCILYFNKPIGDEFIPKKDFSPMPEHDIVFFASTSAVKEYVRISGRELLKRKIILSIGKPTSEELKNNGVNDIIMPEKADIESSVSALAVSIIKNSVEAGDLHDEDGGRHEELS